MKVRCVRYETESMERLSSWLSIGMIYHVLCIYVETSGRISYRIATSEAQPLFATTAYFPSFCFDVVSSGVPSSWVVKIMANSDLAIGPSAWFSEGFMEAFYDRDPEAYSVFKCERDAMIAEDP